jgi:hypothetical protein
MIVETAETTSSTGRKAMELDDARQRFGWPNPL